MTEHVLQALRRRTNHNGLVIVREHVLLDELRIQANEFRTALKSLEDAHAIEVLSPPPFLALKLRKWPGEQGKSADSRPSAYSAIQQLLNKQQSNSGYRHARAHWPIDQALLAEILEVLGETDGKSFEKAVELYSPHVIRKALDRVRKAKGIRKNRTALFRHLLPRLARDDHRFDRLA